MKHKYTYPELNAYKKGFERGKSLQFALNSLWNLYLDGVKMSIFPPIQMVADDVVPSTIKMEPAAKWLLTKSGAEIKTFNTSPQGINTFQSTYNFLIGAILNMAGTTDTSISTTTDSSMGKTPQALQLQATREGTRDSWDRFMMEEALEDVMGKFVNITANSMTKDVELRLFAKEIKEIAKVAPDVTELVDGADRGMVKISKDYFDGTKFDYQMEKGSTYQADQQKEQSNITGLLNFTIQNWQILEPQMEAKGKMIDIAELYQRSIIVSGLQDWEKIVVDKQVANAVDPNAPVQDPNAIAGQMPQMPGQPQMPQVPGMPQGPQAPAQPVEKGPSESINFKDLPPEGKVQLAAKAGIQLDPQSVQPVVQVPGTPQDPQMNGIAPAPQDQSMPQSPSGPLSQQYQDPAIKQFAQKYLNG